MIDGDRNFLLEPYDVVHVRRSPAFHTARNITVSGEVNYEGSFTLENKEMRLSDAIKMAGGITEQAYLRGARLTRTMTAEERTRMSSTLDAVRTILTDKGDSVAWNKMELGTTYPLAIDLEGALKNPGSDKDVILREGDVISVPEYNSSVKVSGDVFFPNTVFYEHGKDYKYYVAQAGGFGHRAKKSRSFIVYQNGQIGLTKQGAKPEPGCEIVVPSKKKKNPMNITALVGALSGTASLASMAAAIVIAAKR